MRVVKIAFGMFALTLLSPAILSCLNVDPFTIVMVTTVGLFATAFICVPGTARLVVSVARKLEE